MVSYANKRADWLRVLENPLANSTTDKGQLRLFLATRLKTIPADRLQKLAGAIRLHLNNCASMKAQHRAKFLTYRLHNAIIQIFGNRLINWNNDPRITIENPRLSPRDLIAKCRYALG